MNELESDRARESIRYQGEIERLHEQLKAERTERQYLNDRLCQKLGLAPIHEPSPGEAVLREQAASVGRQTRMGPRAAAIAAGTEAHDRQKSVIKKEVEEYLHPGSK